MNSINIMVVGLGRWGHLWLEDIRENENYNIVSVVDNDFETIGNVCSEFQINERAGYINLEKAIDESNPDVALIVLPPKAHYQAAKKCIQKGVNILSEKPLANDMAEAESLLKLSQNNDVVFMVSQDYRWQPTPQTVRQAISDGVIGKVDYITFQHLRSIDVGGWREKMNHVVLEDMAIHHFDLLRYFLSADCKEVYAESFNPKWSWYEGGATTSVLLNFGDGLHVNYFGSWVTTGKENGSLGELRIEGDEGSLRVDSDGQVFRMSGEEEARLDLVEMEYVQRPYALREMQRAIYEGKQPETSIQDNIKSFAIIRTAIKSAQEHRPVSLSEVLNESV